MKLCESCGFEKDGILCKCTEELHKNLCAKCKDVMHGERFRVRLPPYKETVEICSGCMYGEN